MTTDLVIRLIRSQFPAWSGLAVRPVTSHGTVNALFRIGDDLVARLPIQPGDPVEERKDLEAEADAARRLHAISPYPTPEPIELGEPGEGYPLPWAVYSWLPGTIAYDADVAGSTGFAEDLATFVRALRAVPTEGRVFTGSWRGGVLTSQDDDVADGLERSRGMIDVDALGKLWADLRTTPRTEPDVWAHRDLMPGNLLADNRRSHRRRHVHRRGSGHRPRPRLEPPRRQRPRRLPYSDRQRRQRMAPRHGLVVRAGDRLPLVLRRDQPGHVPHRPPHPDGPAHSFELTNTNSFPGRSGASRTSSTANPAAVSDSSTSSRSRNRSVESDVSTAPSDANT